MDTAKLVDELIRDEGLRLRPYMDSATPPRITIGVGRNLSDVGISKDEAFRMLHNDLERVTADLDQHLPWWGLDLLERLAGRLDDDHAHPRSRRESPGGRLDLRPFLLREGKQCLSCARLPLRHGGGDYFLLSGAVHYRPHGASS
jgi:hypothetical protein